MNNEEIMEIEEMEIEEDVEIEEEPEQSGNGILGAILATLAVGAAGTGFWLWKTKEKRKEKRIEKLRKEGYVIYHPDEPFVIGNDDEDGEDNE